MKVLFDLIHPANYHYFKYVMHDLTLQGHSIRITARNKDVLFDLLDSEKLEYFNMGGGGKGRLGKFLYLLKAEIYMFYNVVLFRPDYIISFSSAFAAHIAFVFKIPHITFDDTEHNVLNRRFYAPFSRVIFTPDCFGLEISESQIKFPGFMELFYLHPNRYSPNPEVLKYLGVDDKQRYVVVRFVSWGAMHDIGQAGLDLGSKIELIEELSRHVRVFITSESKLPRELAEFEINIPASLMHDALHYACLFIGEGSTMASESAILGTPAIYINSLSLGYMNTLQLKYNLAYNFREPSGVKEKALEIIRGTDSDAYYKSNRDSMLLDVIDPSQMLLWFILNYPNSSVDARSLEFLKTNFN